MTPEIMEAPETELALAPQFHAVAVNATEMLQASNGIQNWLRAKVESIDAEIAETQAAHDSAATHKWKTSTFKTKLQKLGQKRLYYGKLLSASEAGFTIVPNMPMDVFAIRVKRDVPKWRGNTGTSPGSYWSASPSVPDEEEQRMPVGEGEYRAPLQDFYEIKTKEVKDGKELYKVEQVCQGWKDIEFPLAVAHPMVMDATARAMAMKIFDRIGVVPATGKRGYRGDPIVLGQITRKEGWSTKTASFLIAWYLDPRTL